MKKKKQKQYFIDGFALNCFMFLFYPFVWFCSVSHDQKLVSKRAAHERAKAEAKKLAEDLLKQEDEKKEKGKKDKDNEGGGKKRARK
jgi:hypothetical protein